MIDDETRRKIHKSIAKVIEKEALYDKDNVLFELVHHYIEAGDEEKMRQYLIPAADKAKASYANEEAVKYYNMGAYLIKKEGEGSKEWIDCYSKLVDVYLTMGKNDEAIELLEEMLKYVPEKIERARIYKRIGRAYFKKGSGNECEENFAKSLRLLGERIPKSRLEWEFKFVVELVIHIYRSIFMRDFDQKDLELPKEKDIEAISVLIGLNWYYMLSDHSKLKGIVLKMLNMTEVKLSGTDYLGTSLSGYAAVLASLPMFKRSMKYQNRAIKLRKRIGEKWGLAQSFQFLGFAYSWKGEHDKSVETFQKAIDIFSEIGDMWELGMVLSGSGYGYRYTSKYKEGIEVNRKYFDVSKKNKNTYGVISAHIELAFCFLESGSFDEAENNLKSALELNVVDRDYYLYCCTLICKGYMKFEKGEYEKAIKTLEEAKDVEENNSFIKDYTINVYPYYAEALIKKSEKSYAKGRLDKKELKSLMYFSKKALRKTKSWANHHGGALRCLGKTYFLAGKKQKARKFLIKSILHTRKAGRRYETAKGFYELAIIYRALGLETRAKRIFNTANEIFKEIGAIHYVKKCYRYLERTNEYETYNSMSSMKLNMERRLSTILNTSRYLSSILDLDELMEKIMDSVLEHVGAERVILFLYPEEGEKKLEAFVARNVLKEEITTESFKVSRSIIKKVEEEKVPLIVSDALIDQKFNMQESVIINKIRTVMCTPIMSKGEILGVIYLDNSLIGDLFSVEELEILDLIACQAGVSVENARLYNKLMVSSKEIEKSRDEIKIWNETLEQRVIERTEELEIMSNKHKDLAEQLNIKNIELKKMIEKLKEHAQTVEELAITKERNRFAMDAHSMVLLIKLLEVCKMEMMNNPEKAKERLKDAIHTARECTLDFKRHCLFNCNKHF